MPSPARKQLGSASAGVSVRQERIDRRRSVLSRASLRSVRGLSEAPRQGLHWEKQAGTACLLVSKASCLTVFDRSGSKIEHETSSIKGGLI